MSTAAETKQLTLTGDTVPGSAAFSPGGIWAVPFPGWTHTKYAHFIAYHYTHKSIWKEFERLALELINAGEKQYSADAILHVIRFQNITHKRSADEFKVNNNFSCAYSRAFQRKYPQHFDFFETRETAAERVA
jgi:hypothetical protein